jgi:hypothetical protein
MTLLDHGVSRPISSYHGVSLLAHPPMGGDQEQSRRNAKHVHTRAAWKRGSYDRVGWYGAAEAAAASREKNCNYWLQHPAWAWAGTWRTPTGYRRCYESVQQTPQQMAFFYLAKTQDLPDRPRRSAPLTWKQADETRGVQSGSGRRIRRRAAHY